MLVLSALGLGQVFGAIGNLVGQLNLLAGGSLNVPGMNVDPQQLVNALRTGALVGFFSLLISAVAAALGGWLGGRTDARTSASREIMLERTSCLKLPPYVLLALLRISRA
jgi:hypothetical protein